MTAERCPKCQGTRIDPTTGSECGCAPAQASAGPAWTAGPWRPDGHKVRDGKVVSVTISHGMNSYGDGPEGYICVTCEGLDGKSEANARLISAAPDLYEALAEVRFRQYGTAPSNDPMCARIDAALAQARGLNPHGEKK